MRPGHEGAPFAGGEYLHFSIHNFHGHRALIRSAGEALLPADRIRQRQQCASHQRHRDQQLSHERAALTCAPESGARTFLSAATAEPPAVADSLVALEDVPCCGQECPRSGCEWNSNYHSTAAFKI